MPRRQETTVISMESPTEQAVERTWKISGAYANWELRIAVTPPATGSAIECREPDYASLVGHFRVLVNDNELSHKLNLEDQESA